MIHALEVRNLHAGYADREILKGVSFSVAADDFFAIIGPSGAGKSTLIRCVNRLVEPTGGEVLFDGRTSSRSVSASCARCAATSA